MKLICTPMPVQVGRRIVIVPWRNVPHVAGQLVQPQWSPHLMRPPLIPPLYTMISLQLHLYCPPRICKAHHHHPQGTATESRPESLPPGTHSRAPTFACRRTIAAALGIGCVDLHKICGGQQKSAAKPCDPPPWRTGRKGSASHTQSRRKSMRRQRALRCCRVIRERSS